MTATVLVGASGLIGQAVASSLTSETFNPVWVLASNSIEPALPHHLIRSVNFAKLETQTEGIDLTGGTLICTLDTRLRQAVSTEAMVRVNRDRVVRVAHWARDRGAKHCLVVSSRGANGDSRNLYLRSKGQAEQELLALSFQRLTLLRPSWLVGESPEAGLAEKLVVRLARSASPLLACPLMRRYRPMDVAHLARLLVHQAASNSGPMIDIWEAQRINRWRPDSD